MYIINYGKCWFLKWIRFLADDVRYLLSQCTLDVGGGVQSLRHGSSVGLFYIGILTVFHEQTTNDWQKLLHLKLLYYLSSITNQDLISIK